MYDALKDSTPLQANDPRLWTYLNHVTFWRHKLFLEHPEVVSGGDRGRDLVRDLMRELNLYGGVCILDHLEKAEIKEIAAKKLEVLLTKK